MRWKAQQVSDKWVEYRLIVDDMEVHFLNYGGIITKILVPDQYGHMENVILGYDDVEAYQTDEHFLGALIGRVGGRIANSHYLHDDKHVQLTPNEGENHLHGGPSGFHNALWHGEVFQDANQVGVKLTHTSPVGENGYPGNLDMTVTYTLKGDKTFTITYEAISDEDTLLAPTNHMYFNLSGNGQHPVHQHIITANCSKVIEVDQQLLPTGNLIPVEGTPFDFRKGRTLADGINGSHPQNMIAGNGFDHYCVFQQRKKRSLHVADPISKRELAIYTTEPGFVLYTANSLETGRAIFGRETSPYQGVCFETQAHPASLQMEALDPVRLAANASYRQETTYQLR